MKLLRSTPIVSLGIALALMLFACGKHAPVDHAVSPMPLLTTTPEDKNIVVARVNNANISRLYLIGAMNRMANGNPDSSSTESREKIRQRALDHLILEEVVYQEAVRRGLHIPEPDIDKAIAKLRKNAGNEQQFQTYLTKGLMTEEELRSQVERLLLIDAIFTREVREKVVMSDEDVRKEYERQKDQFIVPEKLVASDIIFFLKMDDPASLEKANAILAKLNADKDKDPGNLAPDNTFIVRNMDFDQEKNKEPELYEVARKLKQGDLSPVIKTKDSIHILKVTTFTPQRWKSLEEVKITIEMRLKSILQKKRRDVWEQELLRAAKIEIMAEPGLQKGK